MKLGETFQTAADFSRVTHADPRCIVSCCLVTGLIRGLLRGEILTEEDIDTMIGLSLSWIEDWIVKENQNQKAQGTDGSSPFTYPPFDVDEFNKHVRAESLEELQLDEARAIGYVYKTLGAGIWTLRAAMRRIDSQVLPFESLFEELITSLVLCGGDADTNAAVAGSLLGALVGFGALPASWKHGLMHAKWLSQKCNALASVCGIFTPSTPYNGIEDPDTRVDGGKPPLTKEELYQREREFMEEYMVKSTLNAGAKKGESGWMGRLLRG
jgi:ADP-ribosylglycohydrolase